MKINLHTKKWLFGLMALSSSCMYAQVQLNLLPNSGYALYDINDSGKAIHGNGYYDFETNTSSNTETGVLETKAINNNNQILGSMETDDFYAPALKNGNDWALLPNFVDGAEYILYGLSENGVYAVGQTGWTPEVSPWGFIYNIETETLTILSSDLYENGAAYAVNNEGVAVGWVDDLPTGTVRMPAYFTEDGSINLISESIGEANSINENGTIVGVLNSAPFIYDMTTTAIQNFVTPDSYLNSSFIDISNNGVIVGSFTDFTFNNVPLIYHASLGETPLLLTEVLATHGVDTTGLDGTAYRISSDGNYIAGFGVGPAFVATGWAVNFDDLLISDDSEGCLDTPNGLWPSAHYTPECNGLYEIITNVGYTGEFSYVAVTEGNTYTFRTSEESYFITIGDALGENVLTSGTGLVTWTATYTGDVRFITHFDDECNYDSSTFLSRFVKCGEEEVAPICEEQMVVSNNFENGTLLIYELGIDIPVGDEGFTIYGIEPVAAGIATSFSFKLYSDNYGLPGDELGATNGQIIDSELTGSNSGLDFYKYTISFEQPFDLEPNTRYWLSVTSDAWGWESTTVSSIGYSGAYKLEGEWDYVVDAEFVYNLICEELSINDINSFDFTYYPNPVKDYLNIDSKTKISNVSAFNLAGQKVLTISNVKDGKINMSNLPTGTYVFRITLEDGKVETFKVIKK